MAIIYNIYECRVMEFANGRIRMSVDMKSLSKLRLLCMFVCLFVSGACSINQTTKRDGCKKKCIQNKHIRYCG